MKELTNMEVLVLTEVLRRQTGACPLTARQIAYLVEGGARSDMRRACIWVLRALLYRMAGRGLVAARHYLGEGGVARLGWHITSDGREALRAALRVRCPYCGSERREGEAYPSGHHKMSCYATREVEARLGCFEVPIDCGRVAP